MQRKRLAYFFISLAAVSQSISPVFAGEQAIKAKNHETAIPLEEVDHYLNQNKTQETIVIEDAALLDVHISYANLPADALVEIAGKNNNEVYRYAAEKILSGSDDHHVSFDTLSIFGDSVTVRLLAADGSALPSSRQAEIAFQVRGEAKLQDVSLFNIIPGDKNPPPHSCFKDSPFIYNYTKPVAVIRDTYDREKPHYNTGWRIGEKGVDGDLLVLSSFPLKEDKKVRTTEVWFVQEVEVNPNDCTSYQIKKTAKVKAFGKSSSRDGKYRLLSLDFAGDKAQEDFVKSLGYLGIDPRDETKVNDIATQKTEFYLPQAQFKKDNARLYDAVNKSDGTHCAIELYDREAGQFRHRCSTYNNDMGNKNNPMKPGVGAPLIDNYTQRVLALSTSGELVNGYNQAMPIARIWPQIKAFFPDGAIPDTSFVINGQVADAQKSLKGYANASVVQILPDLLYSGISQYACKWWLPTGVKASKPNPDSSGMLIYEKTGTVTDPLIAWCDVEGGEQKYRPQWVMTAIP